MSRATAALLAMVDAIHPQDEGDPHNPAANDELPLARLAPSDAGPVELAAWIDALALTLAAGLRVGASERERATSTTSRPEIATAIVQDESDAVLTVDDAAVLLKLGRNAIYESVGRGEIPHRRIGNRLRFSKAALIRWLGGNDEPR